MASYVLVHGAWHGGWCWERVAPLLKEQGHLVLSPDLPGMGEDTTPLEEITLDRWTDFVSDLASRLASPVILVGHSRGGLVISEVAERIPDKIDTLVYLAALLLRSGETLLSSMASLEDGVGEGVIVASEDAGSSTVAPESVAPVFYNTSSPQASLRASNLLCPEPAMSFVTPLRLTDSRFGSVRRTYIETLRDNAVPIDFQRRMQAELPCAAVRTMDTDHSPFFSAPEELVDHLLSIDDDI